MSELPAGYELDCLVAKAMGYEKEFDAKHRTSYWLINGYRLLAEPDEWEFQPSELLEQAIKVQQKFPCFVGPLSNGKWMAIQADGAFNEPSKVDGRGFVDFAGQAAIGDTAPEAICRLAVKLSEEGK